VLTAAIRRNEQRAQFANRRTTIPVFRSAQSGRTLRVQTYWLSRDRISIRLQCNSPRVRPSKRSCSSQHNAAFCYGRPAVGKVARSGDHLTTGTERSCLSQRSAAFASAGVSKTHDASLIAEVGHFTRIAGVVSASSGVCELLAAQAANGLPTWICDADHRCGDECEPFSGSFQRRTVAPIKDASCVFDWHGKGVTDRNLAIDSQCRQRPPIPRRHLPARRRELSYKGEQAIVWTRRTRWRDGPHVHRMAHSILVCCLMASVATAHSLPNHPWPWRTCSVQDLTIPI
jgi:hypothetical protein